MLKKYLWLFFCLTAMVTYAQKEKKIKHKKHKHSASLYGDFVEDPKEKQLFDIKRLRDPNTGKIPTDIRQKELAFAKANFPENSSRSTTTWQSRGPNNLGGRTRALALDVTNENIILAGQTTGGMWRSEDGGLHFTKTTLPTQFHSATCVAQDKRPGKTNIWYHGTGESYGIVNAAGFSSQRSGNGIFKSTDGGRSWQQLSATVSNTPTTMLQRRDFDFVWEIVTDPTNTTEDEVYAAVANGIWRSVDGGNSWQSVLGLDSTIAAISEYTDIAITSTGVLYATVSSETPSKGIWRSTDGINWTKITPTGFPSSYNRIEIGIAPSDESIVYFIAESPGAGATGHALWKYNYITADGAGANGKWTNLTTNIPNGHCTGFYTFDFEKFNSQSSYDLYIAVSPTDTNLVFLGGTNIYRSSNGWSTPAYDWIGGYQCDTAKISNYVYPHHHPDQHKMVFYPSNAKRVLTGDDGGIQRTEDITDFTVSWTSMNNWYNTGQFYTCAIEPGNTNSEIIIGGLQDNGTLFTPSIDYRKAWKSIMYGDGSYCAITHGRDNYYLSWQSGKTFKCAVNDTGKVLGIQRIDPQGGGNNYLFINPFLLDPTDDNRMYLTNGKQIWRNDSLKAIPILNDEYTPGNIGWSRINSTSTGTSILAPRIAALTIAETNPNILYYSTDNGKMYRVDSARNNAAPKTDITAAEFPASAYLACISVDPTNENNVLACFSNYGVKSIFYSEDKGASWSNVSGNLEENTDGTGNGPSVPWVNIYFDGTKKIYYAGTSIGLFSTENFNGTNTIWTQEGTNTIGNVVINMITSRTADQTVVVATHGGGMYSNKVFTTAIKEASPSFVKILVQPNPFVNDISIFVESAREQKAAVVLRDISGKEIYRTQKDIIIGENFFTIDNLAHLSAGVYLLQIGDKTKKIVKN